MATQLINSFTSFDFTDREKLDACILSLPQKQWIQNLKSDVAERLISLEFDTEKPLQRLAEDAELKGQLKILTYLIMASEESEEQLLRYSTGSDFNLDA